MPLSSLLSGLTEYVYGLDPSKQERLVRALLPRAIKEGQTVEQSFQTFTRKGFNVQPAEFVSLYTSVKAKELSSGRVRYVNRTAQINESILYPSFAVTDVNYEFVAQYEIFDAHDNKWHVRTHSIRTDTLGTRQEIEDDILDDIIERYPFMGDLIRGVSLRYGSINIRKIP